MDKWKSFLDSLSTTGATVMLLFVLTQITFVLMFFDTTKFDEIMYMTVGALLLVLKGESRKQD